MKSVVIIGITMIMLLAADWARAEVCEIVNGSFEDDMWINPIEEGSEPNGWDIIDIPQDKFKGTVGIDWPTKGSTFNLTLESRWKVFSAGDMATVSQQVCLTNVHQIIFDLKLQTDSGEWDPNICSAAVLIDDDVVWESNSVGPDVRGEYFDQVCVVPDKYRTQGMHKLSLGIRINVGGEKLWKGYITHWDSVRFNLYCGGGGLLPGDIDRSCCVDANDLKLLAEMWLGIVDPNDPANLSDVGDDPNSSGGIISFLDFAIYAAGWDGNMTGLRDIAMNWLQPVDLDYEYNLFEGDDILPSGIIDFYDFAVFADAWLDCSYPQEP